MLARNALVPTLLLAAAAACDDAPATKTPAPAAEAPPPSSASDVGTLTIRRLNSAEYDNTVRDLLGDTSHPSASFPPDDGADSFTNVADALSMSPVLFEQYEATAEKLAIAAAQNPSIAFCDASIGRDTCATRILSAFLPRAFRRVVPEDEVLRYVALVESTTATGASFTSGIQAAIQAALVSPSFLFEIESDPDPSSSTPHLLNDYELASRLSYFLWSSMPDDVLLAYARVNGLSDPDTFDRQVERMLDDPKAQTMIREFATPWLMQTLSDAAPDPTLFPGWSEDLRASMAGETQAFLGSFIFGDQSLADIFDANFTFLDARMAKQYGISGPTGDAFVRVPLPAGSHRGGILAHASVLTMTSVATRTSPVRRGAWVLSELLCAPPPPPPPGVPALEAGITVGTMRQRMAAHRQNPICATCHSLLDPIGLSLEHYDAIGNYRETDQGMPIDVTGQLPGGKPIDGEAELAAAIKADPRFARCATKKLYTFALGRVTQGFDEARLLELTSRFIASGYRVRALINDIVHTDAFRMRHGGE